MKGMKMKEESLLLKYNNFGTDEDFIKRQDALFKMNGWFSPASHGLFSFFLDFQNQQNISGNLGEVGVWEGKSASVICNYCKEEETVVLIDPILSQNKDVILNNINTVSSKVSKKIVFCNIVSEKFESLQRELHLEKSLRFFHIDGCHTATNVYSDLELADKLLTNDAVLVVDDFFNPIYPQITEALYRYLFINPYKFRLFLGAFNKAYLCRAGAYQKYYSYCMENLQKNMVSKKMYFAIKKTSSIDDCFTLVADEYKADLDPETGKQGPDWEPEKVEYIEKR